MLRNVASQKWRVYAWDVTTGLAKTGDASNISAYIQKDDGAGAATNDAAPTEVDSTNQPGYYDFDLTQAETDAAKLSLSPKSSTSNIAVIACPPVVYTRPQYFSVIGVSSGGNVTANVTQFGGTNGAFTGGIPNVNTEYIKSALLDGYAGTNFNVFFNNGVADTTVIVDDVATLPTAPTDWLTAAALATDAVNEIRNAITGGAYDLDTDANGRIRVVDGTGTGELDTTSGLVALTTASISAIADQVWDEILSGHAVSGSTGEALSAAGGAGDPWITTLPGSYTAGQAGYILGTNLNATVSSRATQTSVDTIDGIVDSILVDTAEIGAAGAGLTALAQASIWTSTRGGYLDNLSGGAVALASGVAVTSIATGAITAASTSNDFVAEIQTGLATSTALSTLQNSVNAIDDYLDTEIAAILADTNELQTNQGNWLTATGFAVAGDAMALTSSERNSTADALLDRVNAIETGVTLRQSQRAIAAILTGLLADAGEATETYKGIGQASGGTTRVTASVDVDGNRTAVTLNL